VSNDIPPPEWAPDALTRSLRHLNWSWDVNVNQPIYNAITEHGEGLFDTWTKLAYQEPPKDIFGRILWSFGVMGQLLLSIFTFPAALGAFLMEEAVQSAGMGAYILSSSRYYDTLLEYLPGYKNLIEGARIATKTLATINPITGGSVLHYMDAAAMSYDAFFVMAVRKQLEQMEKDEALRLKLLREQQFGDLYLTSSPSQAEIWINDENTELLTPQTFKNMEGGAYDVTLRRMDVKTEEWQIYSFTVNIEPGRKKEIRIRIPQNIVGEGTDEGPADETETDKMPPWVNAVVEGDYAVDGDTFRTKTGERIRILGIDAPETGRPWASEASAYLDDLVHNKDVSLKIQTHKPIDEYGRTLAICKMYKGDIAELILVDGLARVNIFPDDIYDSTSYILAEEVAKTRKIGIWSKI